MRWGVAKFQVCTLYSSCHSTWIWLVNWNTVHQKLSKRSQRSCWRNVKKLSKRCQKVVKEMSKKLSKRCQRSCQRNVKKLSKRCQRSCQRDVKKGEKLKKLVQEATYSAPHSFGNILKKISIAHLCQNHFAFVLYKWRRCPCSLFKKEPNNKTVMQQYLFNIFNGQPA